jgi:hypothetical protein
MASVSGSRLAFFTPSVASTAINVVLTPDGNNIPTANPNGFNIEVFTSTAGILAQGLGYPAGAFIPGATLLSNNAVQAATTGATEELFGTGYSVLDQTGSEKIKIVGSGAGASTSGGSSITVFGSIGDTITGSSVAGDSQLIDASGTRTSTIANIGVISGPETVTGGAGSTTVYGGSGDSITGGAGSLEVAANGGTGETVVGGAGSLNAYGFGTKASVTGSTGGTSFINTGYAGGGASSIIGGSGTGTLAGGENTQIVTGAGDRVTVGSALTYVNALAGSVTVTGGTGTGTGTIEGTAGLNTNIVGGKGDVITLGAGASWVDASAGTQTVTGGNGLPTVWGGKADLITGGAGALQVDDRASSVGGAEKITGGSGNLFVFDVGKSVTVSGSTGTLSTTVINDAYGSGGGSSITGGTGTATSVFGGGAFTVSANTNIIGAAGDSITGQSGSMYVDAQLGSQTVTGGSGAATVLGGNLDAIVGGSGTLRVDITANRSGSEQITVGSGLATLRDVPNPAGTGAAAVTTVTGFGLNALNVIASATSVNSSNAYTATSSSTGGNTTLSFADGSTMTLLGVASIGAIKFTQ